MGRAPEVLCLGGLGCATDLICFTKSYTRSVNQAYAI
jgi:hypothetical protein